MNTKGFKNLWALGLAIILIVGLAIGASADLGKVYLGWVNATRLTVSDTTTLTGAVTTSGDLTVGDDLVVTGDTTFTGNTGFTGDTLLDGDLSAASAMTVTGNLAANGGLTAGGGFGSSGCTISTAGALSCNSNAIIGGTMLVTSTSTFQGAMNVNANLDADSISTGGQIAFTAPTQITVTADSTIATAGYTVIPLYSAGAVGTATITGCSTAGKLTILRNINNQTITITDTSTIMLSGNAALGQYDTLTLLGDGTNCLQISKSDN